ncbi:hypothetical protein BCR33DRAFT_532798 [Rhizoclosmatium globosum]|uniref:ZIC1-5/GLI1-3like C2H2 zinc finger domain-containing protein n=1 Tax=Rhizoclosmatium globosum TaxID=329046 RepID=A0A1Y2BCY7_9FUNG|nr:hypothetical protein BCR33DRAFT_532798 [Rhizoclosmatium globosum]|eukprot:ORY32699.1 hypothetical protein BCR33DRAFT_532798 [Rhizoclosmatium globosum]
MSEPQSFPATYPLDNACDFTCHWSPTTQNQHTIQCNLQFSTAADLHQHLAEAHIPPVRKDNTRTLHICHWLNCKRGNNPFKKRDQLLTHCRSHLTYPKHACGECSAQFKW